MAALGLEVATALAGEVATALAAALGLAVAGALAGSTGVGAKTPAQPSDAHKRSDRLRRMQRRNLVR